MSEFSDIVDAQLAELNAAAGRALVDGTPPPADLPPPGSWLRVYRLDDDGRAHPQTPWHSTADWNARVGTLSTRCRTYRPGRDLHAAVAAYLGVPHTPWPGRPTRLRLVVEAKRPRYAACRRCTALLKRDAEREAMAARERRTATIGALADELVALVADRTTSDAELGRRVRALLDGEGGAVTLEPQEG